MRELNYKKKLVLKPKPFHFSSGTLVDVLTGREAIVKNLIAYQAGRRGITQSFIMALKIAYDLNL